MDDNDSIFGDQNSYEIIQTITDNRFFFISILLSFIFLSIIISYAKIKAKILMDFSLFHLIK